MCGICGIVNKKCERVQEKRIREMNDLASHRGPDDMGVLVTETLALGHRRLSILDTSKAGHQPMAFREKLWIVFNGEIYNYIELREELRILGYKFETGTDTEVILAAWYEWGSEALQKFNGMWAFALYERDAQRLILSRDRFGVKPLYYRNSDEEFTFGSEIKQVIHGSSARVNPRALMDYLIVHNENLGDETMFADVYCLLGGHYMVYDLKTNERKVRKYYALDTGHAEVLSDNEWLQRFSDLLEKSVELRLRSDVMVGTCISGGLDSAAISAIASKIYKREGGAAFTGIHAKGTEKRIDESKFATRLSEALNIDLKIVEPTFNDFKNNIDEVVYTQEEPFGSPSMFMGWHVFKKARECGCKVMLNGQGGDEVMLGYGRYVASVLSIRHPLKSAAILRAMSEISGIRGLELVGYYLYFRHAQIRRLHLERRSFVKRRWLGRYNKDVLEASALAFRGDASLQESEIMQVQLPHLLRYEDRNSMRHGIETRLPFLDYRLVELCVRAPMHLKIRDGWTKLLLRRSMQEFLPSDIVWRGTKLGFEAPEQTWINGFREGMLSEIRNSTLIDSYVDRNILVKEYDRLSLKEKWAYFNVAAWERVYGVKP